MPARVENTLARENILRFATTCIQKDTRHFQTRHIFSMNKINVCARVRNTYNAHLTNYCNLHAFMAFVRGLRRKNVERGDVSFAKSRSRYSVVQILLLATAWWTECAFYTVFYTFFCSAHSLVSFQFFYPLSNAVFRRYRFHCKKQGFVTVRNANFQNARFATVSCRFCVSLWFHARDGNFTL